jgi:hypothetical protein
VITATLVAASAAIAEAQFAAGGGAVVIGGAGVRIQFGGPMAGRAARPPVDEGSGLFPGDEFRRIGDPWWDEVAKDDGGDALPAVAQEPNAGLPAVPPEGDPRAEKPLDAATLSREQQDSLRKESARLAAITGMMSLRRELSAVRQVRPGLEEQQRSFVLAAGRKVLQARLAALGEEPVTRWTADKKRSLEEAIRDALAASLAANESDAARDEYVAEAARREERRKQAAVDALLAEIDRDARLSIDERTRLADGLVESYRESWRGLSDDYARGIASGYGMTALPADLVQKVNRVLGKQRAEEWQARRQAALEAVGIVQMRQPIGGPVAPVRPGVRRQLMLVQPGGGGAAVQVEVEQGVDVAEPVEEPVPARGR